MTIEQLFDSVEPREKAGPVASDRTHYQKDWALCKLLMLHSGGENYLIAFDIHDDVVVFTPGNVPAEIYFYQVKTKKEGRTWSAAQLVTRKKGKAGQLPSMLGKLYGNAIVFPGVTKGLTFVSNVPFKVGLAADHKSATVLSNSVVGFAECSPDSREKILSALKTEHSLSVDPVLKDLLWLHKSDLPLISHDTFTKGRLSEFLEARKPGKYNVPVAYKVLIDEIRRRNDFTKENLTFAEMRRHKAIGRSDFETILGDTITDDTADKTWIEVSTQLLVEGIDLRTRKILKRAWKNVDVRRTDSSDSHFWAIVRTADNIANKHTTLKTLINAGLEELKQNVATGAFFDNDLGRAILLMKAFDVL